MEETKVCRKCGTEKAISEFGVSGKHDGKHKNICKVCNAAYLRELRLRQPEKMRERDRNWAAKNREKISEKNKKRTLNPTLEKKLQVLLKTAEKDRRRNKCSLSLDDLKNIWDKQQGRCVYTGLPLTPKGHRINTVSLDRIDSNGIYEQSNVQLVCVAVNRMKLDHDEKVFIQLCRIVARNNEGEEYPIDLADTV